MSCGYKDCFVPPERHDECAAAPISKCWGRLEHQHVKKRSAGGRRCDVMLCSGHHQCIDAGHRYEGLRLSNRVVMGTYFIENRNTGEILLELEVSNG